MGNSGEGSGEGAVYQEMMDVSRWKTNSRGYACRVRVWLSTVRSESAYIVLPQGLRSVNWGSGSLVFVTVQAVSRGSG
jgi:hypothetical protein